MESFTESLFVSSVGIGNESVQVYDVKTGANIKSYRGQNAASKTLQCIGNSDFVVCATMFKPQLQIWAVNKNDPVESRYPIPGIVNALDVNETGAKYCVMGIKEKIFPYNLLYGRPLCVISRHYQNVTCIKFTSCGNYFASAGDDGFVYLWSIASLVDSVHKSDTPQVDPYYILGQHTDKVSSLAVSGHGLRGILASAAQDSVIKIFDLLTGQIRFNIATNSVPTCLVINEIGSQLYFGTKSGHVKGVNLISATPQTENIEIKDNGVQCHEKDVTCLALSSGNDFIATGGVDADVKLWSISNGRNNAGEPTILLAFQRKLQQGRGPITNLMCRLFRREDFTLLDLDSRILIGEFSNQRKGDFSDSTVTIPVKKGTSLITTEEIFTSAKNLMQESSYSISDKKKNKRNSSSLCDSNKKQKKMQDSLLNKIVKG